MAKLKPILVSMVRLDKSETNKGEWLWLIEYQPDINSEETITVKRYGKSARDVLSKLDFEINRESFTERNQRMVVIAIIALFATTALILKELLL